MDLSKIYATIPCIASRVWMDKSKATNLYQLWKSCPRGDWLLWLAVKLGMDTKLVILATCDCIELSLDFENPRKRMRSRALLDDIRTWCRGDGSIGLQLEWYEDLASYVYDCAEACTFVKQDTAAAIVAVAALNAAEAASEYADYRVQDKVRKDLLAHAAKVTRRHLPWNMWKEVL